jgi:hypothetical protein
VLTVLVADICFVVPDIPLCITKVLSHCYL